MAQITIKIPDQLMSRLAQQSSSIQDIVIKALENYINGEQATGNREQELLTPRGGERERTNKLLPIARSLFPLQKGVETESQEITKTLTWELCGSLEVSEPDSKYIIGKDSQGQVITNYAENVDQVIY
jgi:hypothetical protein